MVNFMENLNISKRILFMAILAVVVTLIVSISGYIFMNSFNNNVKDMHDNGVMELSEVADISTQFVNIRGNMVALFFKYDEGNVSAIDKSNSIIVDSSKKLLENKDTEKDRKEVKALIDEYNQYYSIWTNWLSVLKSGGRISADEGSKTVILGAKIFNDLENFKADEVKQSQKLKEKNQNGFNNSIIMFIIINIVVIAIFLLTALRIAKTIKSSSKNMIKNLAKVSKGDFTLELNNDSKNEFGIMEKALSETVTNISSMINVVKEKCVDIDNRSENIHAVTEEISSSTSQVASSIQDVAKGTISQADYLVRIGASLSQFGNELDTIVKSIKDIDIKSKDIGSMANHSNENMQTLVSSMEKVKNLFNNFEAKIEGFSNNINQINEITTVITDIAEQTNLLALNAAIEAARAGESGKGFSVVADEIRKLAEQSKESLDNIVYLIKDISGQTSDMVSTSEVMGVEINGQVTAVSKSIESFKNIIVAVESVIPKIDIVNKSAGSIDQQKNGIISKVQDASSIAEEVSSSSERIAASSEEINASTEEVTANIFELSNMTKSMMMEVNKFKIKDK